MAGGNLPRQTTDGPKHLTPPAEKPKAPKPPQVREGDVIILFPESGHQSHVGIVVRAASGRWGSHKVVDSKGREFDIAKPIEGKRGMTSLFYGDQITIVGHDESWLRAEQKIIEDRTRLVRPHLTAAVKRMREDREKKRHGQSSDL